MKILSWNINGIRSAYRKGFILWLKSCNADIVGIQEVRANIEQIPKEIVNLTKFYSNFVSAKKKGYSGVGFFSKKKPNSFITLLNNKEYDDEGRLQIAIFGKLIIANVYFPNGNGKNRDNSRIPYKLNFYKKLLEYLLFYKKNGWHILVIGDFNTAHKEIDLAHPGANKNTSGFALMKEWNLIDGVKMVLLILLENLTKALNNIHGGVIDKILDKKTLDGV